MERTVKATIRVKVEWLHACGRREYHKDTSFLVLRKFNVSGFDFYEVQVPWQETPWVVAEWRLADGL